MPREFEKGSRTAEKNDTDIDRRSYLKMVGAGAGFTAGGTGLTSLGSRSVRAHQESPCNTVDAFEDADLSEYEFDRGSSGASVVTSPTYSGAYALEISGTNTEMISMDGLEHYPAAGDVFSTWVRPTNNADRINITYGVQNHLNRYFARVNPKQGRVALYRYEDGSATPLADKSVSLSQDTWYEVQLEWKTDGTHVFTLLNESGSQVSKISGTDSTWTAGGIGYDAYLSDGGTVYFDHTQIHSGREVVSANEVIDSFEDSDLAEYDFDRGSSGASIASEPTYGGSSVLEISGTNTELISTSGLDHYPAAGDVFSGWVRGEGGADDLNFSYGVQDHTNRYFVRVDFADDRLQLYRYENGEAHPLAKQVSGFTLSQDTWYNVEVDWRKSGTHTVTLYDCDGGQVAQITDTDSTWTDGGIGYDAYLESSGGTVHFDYVAIHSSVLDDFEDGDLSEYNGDTGSFTIQNSTVLEGNQTLKGTSSTGAIAHTSTETPRGHEYEASVMAASGSGAELAFLTSVQTPSAPLQNCYYLSADTATDTLSLYRRDDGKSVLLNQTDVTLEEGTEYRLVVQHRKETVFGEIQDASGNSLAAAGAADRTYTDGCLGLSIDGGAPGYFDALSKSALSGNTLDNFENADLSEYAGNTAGYTVQSSTTLEGEWTLECVDSYDSVAHTTVTTTRGNSYSCRVMAGTGSGAKPSLLTCVQDPSSPMDSCYWLRASPGDDSLELFRRDAGSSVSLESTSANIKEGTEYVLALALQDDSIRGEMYSRNGELIAHTEEVSDRTYTSGYFGFYTGGGGTPAYYDYVAESSLPSHTRVEVTTSPDVAQNALDSSMAQSVLSDLNNPSTDTTSATEVNGYRDGSSLVDHSVNVPMEYGRLNIRRTGGTVKRVTAELDYSSMPDSLINDLSDNFNWSSSEKGILVHDESFSDPKFVRHVTESEESDVANAVSDYDGRTDDPHGVVVRNRDGGVYYAAYHDKIYHVNESTDAVVKERKIYQSESNCQEIGLECWKSISASWLSCNAGTLFLACFAAGPATVFSCPATLAACGLSLDSAGSNCREYKRCSDKV